MRREELEAHVERLQGNKAQLMRLKSVELDATRETVMQCMNNIYNEKRRRDVEGENRVFCLICREEAREVQMVRVDNCEHLAMCVGCAQGQHTKTCPRCSQSYDSVSIVKL